MIKLDKELQAAKDKDMAQYQQSHALKDVKLLLEANASEDQRILENLSQSSAFRRAKNQYGVLLELEKLEKDYAGDVFTSEQIKTLAIKYRLRFLPSQLFCGDLDVEVAAKIKEFSKTATVSIDNYTLSRKFFILAPPSMFKLTEKKYERTPRDPILFYQIDEDKYRKIHKWGSDFSIWRRFLGFYWASVENQLTVRYSVIFLTLLTVFGISFPLFVVNHPIWSNIIVIISSFLALLIVSQRVIPEDRVSATNKLYTPNNWNNDLKLVR